MNLKIGILSMIILLGNNQLHGQIITYPVVETGVVEFYNNTAIISEPSAGQAFYGQDATYQGNTPSYSDNGDGTVTDIITGLIWQKEMGVKISYTDAQTWSASQYKSTTMNGDSTVFDVNFLDGRIKGYPKYLPGSNNSIPKTMYFRMVRDYSDYGINSFVDNGDGTITDNATGLMWQQADDGNSRDWENSLYYAENLTLAGYSDWRLPNAKELQSIVDYTRCPEFTNSPAIDAVFSTTEITDPNGNDGQYPYFWTGTCHLDGVNPYTSAVYIAFGEAQGKMNNTLMDVHGAGAQRSDPKSGNPDNYPDFWGPQGDVRYVFNFVRCVRKASGNSSINKTNKTPKFYIYPNPSPDYCIVKLSENYSNITITLINPLGNKVKALSVNNTSTFKISTVNLPDGVYYLLLNADGNLMTEKVVINK